MEYIGKGCFYESALESIDLPPALKRVEENTFSQCKNLRSIVFPDTLEKIGLFAFCNTSVENVKFPVSLREIAQGAFAECKHLRAVEFGEGLKALGTNEYSSKDAVT